LEYTEHYQDIHGAGNFMRSATLKALAIHAADEASSYFFRQAPLASRM